MKKSYHSRNYPSPSVWISWSTSFLDRGCSYRHLLNQPSSHKNSKLSNPYTYSPNSFLYSFLPLLLSAEEKFHGIAKGITKIIWIRKLLSELHFPQKKACKFFCNNKATINISENPVNVIAPSIEINRHFIEKLKKKIISIRFVRSKDQLAFILTKAVTSEAFEQTLCKLGIGDPKT